MMIKLSGREFDRYCTQTSNSVIVSPRLSGIVAPILLLNRPYRHRRFHLLYCYQFPQIRSLNPLY